jgi:hypothetical protein
MCVLYLAFFLSQKHNYSTFNSNLSYFHFHNGINWENYAFSIAFSFSIFSFQSLSVRAVCVERHKRSAELVEGRTPHPPNRVGG